MRTALVAIQLAIDADVLSSADAYRHHLQAAAARALDAAGPCDSRLVVFPEVSGHLAVYALAPAAAHKAKTLQGALASAAVRRPLDVLRGFTTARTLAPSHAVLAAIAPDAEHWWKSVFGPLAKEYRAYIVAGSHFRLADGVLTNSSMLFGPDGFLLATTDKVNLLPGVEDGAPGGLGLHRGKPEVPIVDTPFGKLATVIGYDAFSQSLTSQERFVAVAPAVDIVANPSANPRREWRDREVAQVAKHCVTAHLVGDVLDQHWEGCSQIVTGTGVPARMAAPDRGGHLVAMLDT